MLALSMLPQPLVSYASNSISDYYVFHFKDFTVSQPSLSPLFYKNTVLRDTMTTQNDLGDFFKANQCSRDCFLRLGQADLTAHYYHKGNTLPSSPSAFLCQALAPIAHLMLSTAMSDPSVSQFNSLKQQKAHSDFLPDWFSAVSLS